jgi:hypothetical protein
MVDMTTVTQSKFRTGFLSSRFDLIAIGLIGLLVQGFWATALDQPTYMDAFYYATNGQRLAAGEGFTELVIWQFLDNPTGLPAPSHTYWMPLTSIIAAGGYRLGGDFGGAQSPFWLMAGLLPILSYAISQTLSGERWQAWTAALFTVAGSFYAAFLSQPTTFAPFAWFGASCLLSLGLATKYRNASGDQANVHDRKGLAFWTLAGFTAGLAHLTRADGVIFLILGLAIWLFYRSQVWRRQHQLHINREDILALLLFLFGYLLIMGGWFLRNWLIIGRILPATGTQSMFLTSYDDLFAYGRTFNANSYLSWGLVNILRSKLQSMGLTFQTMLAVPGLIFLSPFIVAAWIYKYRRNNSKIILRPVTWYAVALVVSMTFIFSFPGARGSLFHSSIALWPWSTALAAAGIGLAVDWAAKKLPHWKPERAKRIFALLFVIVAFVVSFAVSKARLAVEDTPNDYLWIQEVTSPSAVVMVGNAPALHYYTGLAAISVPNEPVEIVLQAADRYGVTHLVLNENRPLPLDGLYNGEDEHPRVRLIETLGSVKLYKFLSLADD